MRPRATASRGRILPPMEARAEASPDRSDAFAFAFDARCPRCGYDQTGTLAAMRDACPLESRCVECGLEFRWGDLSSGRLSTPQWLVEHAPALGFPIALLKTFLVAPVGVVLWRQLRLEHPTRSGRLLALPLAALVAVLLVVTFRAVVEGDRSIRTMAAAMPIGSTAPSAADRMRTALRTIVLPLSDRAERVVAADPMGAPRTLMVASPRRRLLSSGSPVLAAAWGLSFVAATASALAFLALPFARTRAKAEPRHLARCVVYLFATLPFVALVILVLEPNAAWGVAGAARSPLDLLTDPRVLGAWGVWLFPWWWSACRFYVRMRHAWLVAAAVTGIGFAGAAIAAIAWA